MSLKTILTDSEWSRAIDSMIKRSKGGLNGETLFYYIDDKSLNQSSQYIDYIEDTIKIIDRSIDLDFKRTFSRQECFYDINLYSKNTANPDNVLGRITTKSRKLQVDIFLRDSNSKDFASNQNTFLHEFLHGLGLGEPGYDNRYDQTDTALSYNLGKADEWRTQPSEFDSQMLLSLWGSENDSEITPLPVQFNNSIGRLYKAAFGRIPDQAGVDYWTSLINDNILNYQGVASLFVDSTEFESRYGSNVSNKVFITNLYLNVLGRSPDPDGLLYWLSQMNNGSIASSQALIGFADSLENTLNAL